VGGEVYCLVFCVQLDFTVHIGSAHFNKPLLMAKQNVVLFTLLNSST